MPRLLKAEREQIIEDTAAHTKLMSEKLRDEARNWTQLSRYIGLIGLRGMIEAPWLQPHEVAHVKKMTAYEARHTLEGKRRPPKAAEFWQDIEEQVGKEINIIRYSGTRLWDSRKHEWAFTDLKTLHDLLDNPLMIDLRQSVRDIQDSKE